MALALSAGLDSTSLMLLFALRAYVGIRPSWVKPSLALLVPRLLRGLQAGRLRMILVLPHIPGTERDSIR